MYTISQHRSTLYTVNHYLVGIEQHEHNTASKRRVIRDVRDAIFCIFLQYVLYVHTQIRRRR